MKKKITAFLMSVCLLAVMTAEPVHAASKKAYIKTGVSSKVTVLCGKTLNLKAKTVNKKKKITYKSSKKSVATVSSKGIVKGKKYGTAVITLKASGMSTKKVKVYVRKPVTSIKLTSKASLTLGKGKTSQIKTKVYPGGKQMVNAKLYYKSSNTKVATVSSVGKITAKSGGYAKITVSTSKSAGKVCTKYVDVFVYQGFDDVCVETSGNTTLFTVNPNWAGLKVSFKGKNGKTYSYEFDNVKLSFAMIKSLKVNSGGSNGQIRIIKKAANKINIALVGTTENYDVYVDYNKYQLKFIQSLKDSKGNLRISFTVEK